MKQFIFIVLTLTFLSCENNTGKPNSTITKLEDTMKTQKSHKNENSISTKTKFEDTIKAEKSIINQDSDSINKVAIDFKKNKDILDIILLLPDSAFSSWGWELNDRIKWYNEIKENNFYIDNNPFSFNLVYFKPYKVGFTIVDGFWSINIYKTAENSYIVITDDIVGDGNSLNFYEVKSNVISNYLYRKTIFSNFREHLIKKETVEKCKVKLKTLNNPIFEFDFTTKNKVVIESSWYLTKKNYEKCLIGNAIVYNFNPKTKKFEIEKIYWKPKEKE